MMTAGMLRYDTGDLSVDLAEAIETLGYEDLSNATVRLAERSFVDTVGVTLAGADETVG